jgi:hypothetical protein
MCLAWVVGMSQMRQVLFEMMKENWADIRTYTSNLWQLATLTLAASALSVSIMLTSAPSGLLLFFTSFGWFGLLLLTGFTFFSLVAARWILYDVKRGQIRIEMLVTAMTSESMDLAVCGPDGPVDATHIAVNQLKKEDFPVWSTKDYVEQFFLVAWGTAVLFWYLQTILVFSSELVMLFTLVMIQALVLTLMIWYLAKQCKE